MSGSGWRLGAAGGTVVVSVASGILVNLVTSKWSVTLAVALGVLVVVGVLLQLVVTRGDESTGPTADKATWFLASIRQRARASGKATVVQAGGDVIYPTSDGSAHVSDRRNEAR